MALLKNQQIIENTWTRLGDDDALPSGGDIIVPLERWLNEREQLAVFPGRVGVLLAGGDDVRSHAGALLDRELIALDFPVFGDGRCYSHARILREQLGYTGELRAVGDVLRDQLFYMYRCGIDAFELSPSVPVESALAAFRDFSVVYQPAADEPLPLFRRA